MENNNGIGQVLNPPPSEIIDFTNMDRKGTVVIKPKIPVEHKNSRTTINGGFKGRVHYNKNSLDPKVKNRKLWIGIEQFRHPNGSVKWQQIALIDGRILFLENEQDAKEWHVLRNHPEIAGSINAIYNPKWLVEDREADARIGIEKRKSARKAEDWLEGMSEIELLGFARLPEFNLDPMNNSKDVILNTLLRVAVEHPERINKYKEDREGYHIMTAVQRGISVGIIQMDHIKGYMFKETIPLGQTPDMVRAYLSRDQQLLMSIDIEGKALDELYQAELLKQDIEENQYQDNKKNSSDVDFVSIKAGSGATVKATPTPGTETFEIEENKKKSSALDNF